MRAGAVSHVGAPVSFLWKVCKVARPTSVLTHVVASSGLSLSTGAGGSSPGSQLPLCSVSLLADVWSLTSHQRHVLRSLAGRNRHLPVAGVPCCTERVCPVPGFLGDVCSWRQRAARALWVLQEWGRASRAEEAQVWAAPVSQAPPLYSDDIALWCVMSFGKHRV